MCSTSLLYKILPTRKTISCGAVLLSYRPRTKIPFFCPIQVFNCAIFFTILQGKLYSFNIQDDRSTRFLCTTNYCIELTAWSLLRRCFIIRFVLFEDMGECEARGRAADLFFIARARGALRN